MSDSLHHECGVAAIRLLKPLSYFADKYGSPEWAFNKLFLLMEKQHNRGQDGAGIGCVKLNMPLGSPYVFRARNATSSALSDIFTMQQKNLRTLREEGGWDVKDTVAYKNQFNFGGEILMGHLRYGTSGQFDEGSCHPFLRRTNWTTRTLMLLGNFNMTNADELNRKLIERGQHPVFDTDTQAVLEEIGYYLDEAHTDIYRELRDKKTPGREIPHEISKRLDLYDIVGKASQGWDGGYCVMGTVGNGDFFCLRDPHGIRPCHYVLTDEYLAIASERVPLMSVMEVECGDVYELPRANMIVVKNDGKISIKEYTTPLEPTPCSFEAIYFSRGNDPIIYRERKALGANLAEKVVECLGDENFSHAAITYIPNTAEVSYYGLLEGLRAYRRDRVTSAVIEAFHDGTLSDSLIRELIQKRWPRAEKIAHKDIKLRTFISEESSRKQLAAQVYDLTYGAVGEEEVLIAIDDSIVRGTTLRSSLLRLLARSKARKIVILSSAPQIRYPDCYGIDMSELGKFIAFQAAISLLQKRGDYPYISQVYEECCRQLTLPPEQRINPVKKIYAPFTAEEITKEISHLVTPDNSPCEVEIIYQTLEGLRSAIEGPCGDWYFSGNYPTPGGFTTANVAFINWFEGRDGRSYSLPV